MRIVWLESRDTSLEQKDVIWARRQHVGEIRWDRLMIGGFR